MMQKNDDGDGDADWIMNACVMDPNRIRIASDEKSMDSIGKVLIVYVFVMDPIRIRIDFDSKSMHSIAKV